MGNYKTYEFVVSDLEWYMEMRHKPRTSEMNKDELTTTHT
jgi:hypothetical protein